MLKLVMIFEVLLFGGYLTFGGGALLRFAFIGGVIWLSRAAKA